MTTDSNYIDDLFRRFADTHALVIGDVMIDAYIEGAIERMSPEAPVPIVTVRRRFHRLGGAANVAINIKGLGGKTTLCSVIGNDNNANAVLLLMKEHRLDTSGLIRSDNRITTLKQRILNQGKQVLRLDEESLCDLNATESDLLETHIQKVITQEKPDIIILQDYNKGVLTEKMIRKIITLGKSYNIPIAVDPKKNNFLAYKGATLFKPNAKELCEGLGVTAKGMDDLDTATARLKNLLRCNYVMTTLSDKGILIHYDDRHRAVRLHFPAHKRKIIDVSGAGDTVLSVAALCLAAGCDAQLFGAISNIAGGLVCEQTGVVPVDRTRLLEETLRLCCKNA